jgi:hypothetical protein
MGCWLTDATSIDTESLLPPAELPQVRELEECAPFPFTTPVQTQETLKVAMSEEQAIMKGAFRSVTTLGCVSMSALTSST